MLDGNTNIFALEFFIETFENVSKHIIFSYKKFVENEIIEYVKKKDGKYWVIDGDKQIKPEEFIRNVLISKKYLRNRTFKSNFGIKNLEFNPESGELNETEKSIIGNHDIKVSGLSAEIFGEADEEIYFSFECKRLNNRQQNANEYVISGIRRYIEKKYSSKMPISGMIGFVEEREPKYFVKQINEKLSELNQKNILFTEQYLQQYDINEDFDNLYNSIHKKIDKNEIHIYHFMLNIGKIITIKEE